MKLPWAVTYVKGVNGKLGALPVDNCQSTAIAEYQRESNMTSMSTA